jgi:F-type H+-transporting ATPase subunit delta
MRQSKVTIRYAKALLQLSIEQNLLDQSQNDMLLINATCVENKDLALLLKSPIVKTDQKLRIITEIFDGKIGKLSMMFVSIIATKKRESLLSAIAKSFVSLYKEYNNIESATVTTAIPLTESLKKDVIRYIKEGGDKRVELTEVVDENIIGGAIIRMGDIQLDASVSSELSELRQMFNKNLYLQDF